MVAIIGYQLRALFADKTVSQLLKLLGVQHNELFPEALEKSPYPRIHGNDIYTWGMKMLTIGGEGDAIVAAVLAHSVFHVKFNKKVAPFMFYVQHRRRNGSG